MWLTTGRALSFACFALVISIVWLHSSSPLAAQEESNSAAVRDYNTAAALQNNGVYPKAAQKWQQFIQQYPKDKRIPRVHYYLGICQLHTKAFDDAVKTFQEVLQKYPKFEKLDGVQYNLAMARYQIAAASSKPDDFKKAADAFGAVASKFSDSRLASRALYFQGESLYAAGDADGSMDAYEQLVEKHPDSSLAADAYYYLGVTQQEKQMYDEAAKTFGSFLDKPAFARHELATEIRLRHGICLYEQEKYEEAEKQFAEVAKNEEYALADFALLRQGQCRLETGSKDDAAKLFTDFLKRFPESTYRDAAQLAAGKCYFETDKLDDAEKALSAVARSDKAKPEEQAEAAYWLGRTLLEQGKPEDALKVLEPASQKHAEGQFGPYLLIARADAMYDVPDRRTESAAVYSQFLQKYPEHELAAQATYMSALVALGQDDYKTAREQAENFLKNPAYAEEMFRPTVLFIAGEGYLLGGGQEDEDLRKQAEDFYRQLVENHPQHARVPRALLRIGWCLLEGGKNEEAIKYLTGNIGSIKQPAQQAEAHLMIGRAHARLDRPQEALSHFDQGLQAEPNWGRADELLLESAQALRGVDNPNEAQQRLAQLLSKFNESPLRPQATYQLAEIAHAGGEYDEAIKRFDEVVQKYGDSPLQAPARYGLAAAHFAKGEHEKALQPLDQLLSGTSDDQLRARGQYLRGLARQRLKQFDGAADDLQKFLATKPPEEDSLDARYALALCHVGLEKHNDAEATLQGILADKEDYKHADKVRYELGHALLGQDKGEQAAQAFAALATTHPESPFVAEAHFHVGRHHEDVADSAEAEAEKDEALAAAAEAFAAGLAKAQKPDLQEKLSYKLGDMEFQQEKFAEASATLLAGLEKHPDGELVGPARFLAAESLFRQDKFAEALPLFEKVADDEVEKYHAQAHYRAGTCAGNLKNWSTSEKHFDALTKQFPKFEQITEARYGLAFALQNQNQLDQAKQLYQQVTEETETETAAKARFMIGEIDFGRKKYEDAIEHFLAVAVGYPYEHWQGLARFETGRCFMEMGQNDKAISTFKSLLAKHPDHERSGDATKLLADLQK